MQPDKRVRQEYQNPVKTSLKSSLETPRYNSTDFQIEAF